jgi:hypothetical protein
MRQRGAATSASGADAMIMKHILHDWDDDSATRIQRTSPRWAFRTAYLRRWHWIYSI